MRSNAKTSAQTTGKEVLFFCEGFQKGKTIAFGFCHYPMGTIYLRMKTPQEKTEKKSMKRLHVPDAIELQQQVENGKVGVRALPLSCGLTRLQTTQLLLTLCF